MGFDVSAEVRSALSMRSEFKARFRGKMVDFCCPRHDDSTPSAWLGDGAWGCHACGFTEPIATLADLLGVRLPEKGYTLEDYAREKGFSFQALLKFGLATEKNDKGYQVVSIPYFGSDGQLLRRRFRSEDRKWWEGKNRSIFLYGINRIEDAKEGDSVIIVEGESDCHAAWIHGFHAVGVPGATTWKDEWAAYLRKLNIFVWEEPDQGGAQLVASIARSFPDARVIRSGQAKDIADLHAKKGKDFPAALSALMAAAQKIGTPKPPVVFDVLLGEELEQLLYRKLQPIEAVPTPFPCWNASCCGDGGRVGLARGWHITLAAKTGNGKSILALNMAASGVRAGERVCFISLEMSKDELQTRMLSIASGVAVSQLEKGRDFSREAYRQSCEYMQRVYEQSGGCFFSNREPIHTLDNVVDSIRYNFEVNGSRYFVIDYIQLAANPHEPETIVRASHAIRHLAKDLNVITVGLSQFNRQAANAKERPTPEGLLGGVSLENDSDQVLLLDHSRRNDASGSRKGIDTFALLAKNRHGPACDVSIFIDTQTLRIRELLQDEEPARQLAAV